MAKKETKNEPKDLVEAVPEEIEKLDEDPQIAEELEDLEKASDLEETSEEDDKREKALSGWNPKTKMGKAVKTGVVTDLDEILISGKKILEHQIVDKLINVQDDLLLVGQAKGKFGGGKRRAWRQTQKKTKEGNVLSFSSMAVIGDRNGHVGVGYGKAKETLPSREKALRAARLSVIRVQRGFETIEESKNDPHTIPFKVEGKCGSVRLTLIPAPRGTGLVVGDECKKILKLAGIKDVYGVSKGQTKTTFNLARACIDALSKTTKMEL